MASKPIKALVVDDEDMWCNAIASTAKSTGMDVRKTTDAATAVDCLRNDTNIKVLFQDWFLEGSGTTSIFDDVKREAIRNGVIVILITGALENEAYRKHQYNQDIPWKDWRKATAELKEEHIIFKWEIDSGLETGFLPVLEQKIKKLHLPKEVENRERRAKPRLSPPFKLKLFGDEICPESLKAQIIQKNNPRNFLEILDPERARFLYRLANLAVDHNEQAFLDDEQTCEIFGLNLSARDGGSRVDSFKRWLRDRPRYRIDAEDIDIYLFTKVRSCGWRLCIPPEDIEIPEEDIELI